MNFTEIIEYLDNQITLQKASLKNSLFILSIAIVDPSVPNIEESITKYYNNQLISCKIKRCAKTGAYEIAIWW